MLGAVNQLAVSYTHLDVYKRQNRLFPETESTIAQNRLNIDHSSVSYTHLDVYKRQY